MLAMQLSMNGAQEHLRVDALPVTGNQTGISCMRDVVRANPSAMLLPWYHLNSRLKPRSTK